MKLIALLISVVFLAGCVTIPQATILPGNTHIESGEQIFPFTKDCSYFQQTDQIIQIATVSDSTDYADKFTYEWEIERITTYSSSKYPLGVIAGGTSIIEITSPTGIRIVSNIGRIPDGSDNQCRFTLTEKTAEINQQETGYIPQPSGEKPENNVETGFNQQFTEKPTLLDSIINTVQNIINKITTQIQNLVK